MYVSKKEQHVRFPLVLKNSRIREVKVEVSAYLVGKGSNQGQPYMHDISQEGQLAKLMGIPLKMLAWRICDYCPKLPRLD